MAWMQSGADLKEHIIGCALLALALCMLGKQLHGLGFGVGGLAAAEQHLSASPQVLTIATPYPT